MNDQVFRQYFKKSLHDAAAVGMFEGAKNELLGTLVQDIEEKDGEIKIGQGTAKDRIRSVTDPEMCHGHKTSSHRSGGYKGNYHY